LKFTIDFSIQPDGQPYGFRTEENRATSIRNMTD
jgi:hypothetical protein